jgi:DNA-binding transcriptional ArsR family regulator
MTEHSIAERLGDIEQRLARLEATGGQPMTPPQIDQMSKRLDQRIVDEGLDPKDSPVGEIETYVLIRSAGGTWGWGDGNTTLERLLAADPDEVAKGIAGLAHPVRIALAKALIDGPKESATLLKIAGLNTTGQLYHHLQAMADVGLVERRSRNFWAGQNLAAFALLMHAGVMLTDWRGSDIPEDGAS